jgi:hypothetical protein
MRCADLEHTIRLATEIVEQDSIIVIGSQAILGSYREDELPERATQSVEVDMAPPRDDDSPSLATRLDAGLGEWSMFHETLRSATLTGRPLDRLRWVDSGSMLSSTRSNRIVGQWPGWAILSVN